jgi:hypothetical protein
MKHEDTMLQGIVGVRLRLTANLPDYHHRGDWRIK